MKFGKLIEYNMRHFFLKISYTETGGEASARPKKSKLRTSLDQQSEIL